MSPALNGSSVVRRLECGDAIEICGGIFDFYMRVPHLLLTSNRRVRPSHRSHQLEPSLEVGMFCKSTAALNQTQIT